MMAELRFPAMVVLLSRRIKILQDLSDGDGVGVPLGEVAASGFCLLFFASFGPGALFVGVGVASGFGGPPIPGGEGAAFSGPVASASAVELLLGCRFQSEMRAPAPPLAGRVCGGWRT
ncbi:hypothetical protein C2845_PM12G12190 [Panicum miliaceum]|uniref:Uncharacterized protein n=1 Tax=Panicum miliaceum TaxID=4540 RepID=A0A3L6QK73_PANMI|nr:hypothetical protein C2845_PM12G12190 [Panicum miliaceum]